MRAKSCKNCKYVESWKDFRKTVHYQCRYGPPTAMPYIESSFHIGHWPKVFPDGYCWQFKEKWDES